MASDETPSSISSSSFVKESGEETENDVRNFVETKLAIGQAVRHMRSDRLQFPDRLWSPFTEEEDPKASSLSSCGKTEEFEMPIAIAESFIPLLRYVEKRIESMSAKGGNNPRSRPKDTQLASVLFVSTAFHNMTLEKSNFYCKSLSWEGGELASRWKTDIDKLMIFANTVDRGSEILFNYSFGERDDVKIDGCKSGEWFTLGESESTWLASKLQGCHKAVHPMKTFPPLRVLWGGYHNANVVTSKIPKPKWWSPCSGGKVQSQVAPAEFDFAPYCDSIYATSKPTQMYGEKTWGSSMSELVIDRPSLLSSSLSSYLAKEVERTPSSSGHLSGGYDSEDDSYGQEVRTGPLKVRSFRKNRSNPYLDGDPNRTPIAPTDSLGDPSLMGSSGEYPEAFPLIRLRASERNLLRLNGDLLMGLYDTGVIASHLKHQYELLQSYKERIINRLRSWISQTIAQHSFSLFLQSSVDRKEEAGSNQVYDIGERSLQLDTENYESIKGSETVNTVAGYLCQINNILNQAKRNVEPQAPHTPFWCSEVLYSMSLRLKPSRFMVQIIEQCVAPLLQHCAQLSNDVCAVCSQQCASSLICSLFAFLRDPFKCFKLATSAVKSPVKRWKQEFQSLTNGSAVSYFGLIQLQADLLYLRTWFAVGGVSRLIHGEKGKRKFNVPASSLALLDVFGKYVQRCSSQQDERVSRFWPVRSGQWGFCPQESCLPEERAWITLIPAVGAAFACRAKGFQYAHGILRHLMLKDSEITRSTLDGISWLRQNGREKTQFASSRYSQGGLSAFMSLLGDLTSWEGLLKAKNLKEFNAFLNKQIDEGKELDPLTICLDPLETSTTIGR
eukprot:gb/GECG01010035.1/.p1 GENE.gb/GECG01010035.1/~~gb/GECG01010035.1/.p1  ORF type:complete len:842 (+),score=86.79 gb/GECG01010035.1/:1-2526(+)